MKLILYKNDYALLSEANLKENKTKQNKFVVCVYLIQRFSSDIDAVDLKDFIINSQKPSAFRETTSYQTRYEHSRDLQGQFDTSQ